MKKQHDEDEKGKGKERLFNEGEGRRRCDMKKKMVFD